MSAGEYVRLAWYADREGRQGMRDALLTIAVAESGPDEAVLADRCRRRLVANRPEHWFASFATVGEALSHSRVAAAMSELRAAYPPVRVRQLLLRSEALSGPYIRRRPLSRVVDDLVRDVELGDETPVPPPVEEEPSATTALAAFYLAVLFAMAVLLATVLKPSTQDSKAA